MDDYEAIRQLSARYNRTSDFMDVEGWIGCWTADGYLRRSTAPGPVQGHAELREAVKNPPAPGVHVTSCDEISVDGDRAQASCYLMYLERPGFTVNMFGVYTDELVRTPDGWKYQRRILDVLDAPEA
jgi:hypothetical protein